MKKSLMDGAPERASIAAAVEKNFSKIYIWRSNSEIRDITCDIIDILETSMHRKEISFDSEDGGIGARFAAPARTLYSNETDQLALLAFKDQITSDPSGVLSTWNATTHFCGWEGVTCGKKHQQRVVALELSSRGLVGSVSPSIGNLTFLRKINLQGNSFFDTIPSDIGHLHRLQQLNLSFNSFGGGIPVELCNCSDLMVLDMRSNLLAGRIPDELRSLTKLEYLRLDANNITGVIPPWLGNFSSLLKLSLYSNFLEGSIPEELGNLANLGFFQVSANMLSGIIPLRLYNFSYLYLFNVAVNQLQGGLPPTLGDALPRLNNLWLGDNRFEGPIPASLGNATGILDIDISKNNFSGQVPSNLGRLQGLYSLNLGVNQLEASDANGWAFLDSLTNCSFLQILALDDNRFGGILPESITNLSVELQFLTIGINHISGNIPSGIENLFNLYALMFQDNLLTGNIPEGMGKLQMLQEVKGSGVGLTAAALLVMDAGISSSYPSAAGDKQKNEEDVT
ncbi:putative receptor-like protein kinase [Cocos nucifera]|uniref:Putative receptor-like protein kinase n=1 Tax=Cocos nucifera TaxID=13894 RepID=A0A8K0IH90_COCNU|nr:putative receptor-like protein kinase [Cocos nucifera]